MSQLDRIHRMESAKSQVDFDRDYLTNTKEFFKGFLPTKSIDLLEKLVFVILKKLNQLGLKHQVIVALAANFAKSNSMTLDHAKLICWVAAVRFLIQNDPNPANIQDFVTHYPYQVENSPNSKERLLLQRFERAMYYLTTTDIPFDTERQLVYRICRYLEQGSLTQIDELDRNRVAIYDRYFALRTTPMMAPQSSSTSVSASTSVQASTTRKEPPKSAPERVSPTNYQSQQRPEIIQFPHSNPESPQSVSKRKTPQPSTQASPVDPNQRSRARSLSTTQSSPTWSRMPSSDLIDYYEVILDQLQSLPEIDAFANRIAQILASNNM